MHVLIDCEFSGIVRDTFTSRGHIAYSCDLLLCERGPDGHLQMDAIDAIHQGCPCGCGNPWDLVIAHPPCTHLAVSGARWFKDKRKEQAEALDFVAALFEAPTRRLALENPISIISSVFRKPDQIIQPWMFGHGEVKATCLWLKNLPLLTPTNIVSGRDPRVHREPPSPDRWKNRSRTLQGFADAMADQWGCLDLD